MSFDRIIENHASIGAGDIIEINSTYETLTKKVLTQDAIKFLALLHKRFQSERLALLSARAKRQADLDSGIKPDFLPETKNIRTTAWQVASCPQDLLDRRVEITGPVDRKMMINALNSGAKIFMADFEDSMSPTWFNALDGQQNCMDAVRKTLSYDSPDGKQYRLKSGRLATLIVRPRGWHLEEQNFKINQTPISASLFDFGLYFFHNARELISRGTGPYFYLPKMENHLEARLWNSVFTFAQAELGIPHGSIRATCLIETVLASYEMEEILYELKDHAAGLNAGRWDYIFSMIKKFKSDPGFLMPDRGLITMTVPFMRAYTKLLVQTCHKRGAHAIGGMAAFIPNRRDPDVTEQAIRKVTEDKLREANDGFDGTWVAHPDLVPVAMNVFDQILGNEPNQKTRKFENDPITGDMLINTRIEQFEITETGLRQNVSVALQYLDSWLRGIGAVAIHNLMEDAATAEISRAELWQWIRHKARLSDGRVVSAELYKKIREEELVKLNSGSTDRLRDAALLLDRLVLDNEFADFLTTSAYDLLSSSNSFTSRF
jgi:malate synthase